MRRERGSTGVAKRRPSACYASRPVEPLSSARLRYSVSPCENRYLRRLRTLLKDGRDLRCTNLKNAFGRALRSADEVRAMADNEGLTRRIRLVLDGRQDVVERKMVGSENSSVTI